MDWIRCTRPHIVSGSSFGISQSPEDLCLYTLTGNANFLRLQCNVWNDQAWKVTMPDKSHICKHSPSLRLKTQTPTLLTDPWDSLNTREASEMNTVGSPGSWTVAQIPVMQQTCSDPQGGGAGGECSGANISETERPRTCCLGCHPPLHAGQKRKPDPYKQDHRCAKTTSHWPGYQSPHP